MNIKILVAAHKKYRFPKASIYLPVQVGAACGVDFGITRDDTGENMSEMNPYYCELTGMYWMWKNVDADYYGLVHYRRYFTAHSLKSRFAKDKLSCVIGRSSLETILKNYDIILPKKRHYYIESLYSHYAHTHYEEHLVAVRQIISGICPEYISAYDKVMRQRSGHMFNMMIMSRDKFDAYCSWLFPILDGLESRIDYKSYDVFQARLFGRVSELLLNVWIVHNGFDYKELAIVNVEPMNWIRKITSFITAKFNGRKYNKSF